MSAVGRFSTPDAYKRFAASVFYNLFDVGRIDGLSEFGLFWRVALPLAKWALTALAILTFLGDWNTLS